MYHLYVVQNLKNTASEIWLFSQATPAPAATDSVMLIIYEIQSIPAYFVASYCVQLQPPLNTLCALPSHRLIFQDPECFKNVPQFHMESHKIKAES